ncbi:MAG: EAL domain-containing protein [Treponema sp.]|nr:EAL domain-containing protein [Treponema sp.]
MIYTNAFRLIFIIISIILVTILDVLTCFMFKNKNVYRIYIAWPITIGVFSIIVYTLFLMAETHFWAVFFDSLFFIGTDWLAMFMFIFAVVYTGISKKYKKQLIILCSIACTLDTISLLVNNFTHHSFDLILMYSNAFSMNYWGNDFKFCHYIHLSMCYVMVGLTFIYFAINCIKEPDLYKRKYIGIFVAYTIVIFANGLCYSANLPIDFSVILYAVLAGFICYYSTYSFPHQLLANTLAEVNETISDGIVYFDTLGHCIYTNRSARRIFSKDNVFDRSLAENYRNHWIERLGINDEAFSIDKDTFVIDGKEVHYSVEIQKEFYENVLIGYCMKMSDRTSEINDYLKELYIATHDELTGLYNRTGFFEAVDNLLKNPGFGGVTDTMMLCSNIKDFKLINTLFGEEMGDEVLLKQASILKQHTYKDTVCGRICDDKFALFVKKSYFEEKKFLSYMDSIKALTESSIYQMHIMVGIYEPQNNNETAQSMYSKALMAISTNYQDYNKSFAYYDSAIMDRVLFEKAITDDFSTAIDLHQIKMFLQPIINKSENNSTIGAEALCRWEHPLRGLLKPSDFLEILERAGLIYKLDEYIWTQAVKTIHQWNEKGITNCYISVNVSERDFYYTDIYKTFTSLVINHDINPASLHIEITEGVLMSNFAKALSLATKLQKAGFVIAIDNFGKGYSSLNMLKDFKADILKLDISLLSHTDSEKRSLIILETIVNMANLLNIQIIGEGIVDKPQLEILKQYNCHAFQGNYICQPLSIKDFEARFINNLEQIQS